MNMGGICYENERNHVSIPYLHCENEEHMIYKIKNRLKDEFYYMKDIKSGKYYYYDNELKRIVLSIDKKSPLMIKRREIGVGDKRKGVYQIYYSIYPLMKYSFPNQIKNEFLYLKYIQHIQDSYLWIERMDKNEYQIQLYKDGSYLSSEPEIGFYSD
jgi:hypothetical protein